MRLVGPLGFFYARDNLTGGPDASSSISSRDYFWVGDQCDGVGRCCYLGRAGGGMGAVPGLLAVDVGLELLVDGIDHIARYLGGEDAEIVGQDDEGKAQQEPPAIFPEILINSLQVLQIKNLNKVTTPDGKNLAV